MQHPHFVITTCENLLYNAAAFITYCAEEFDHKKLHNHRIKWEFISLIHDENKRSELMMLNWKLKFSPRVVVFRQISEKSFSKVMKRRLLSVFTSDLLLLLLLSGFGSRPDGYEQRLVLTCLFLLLLCLLLLLLLLLPPSGLWGSGGSAETWSLIGPCCAGSVCSDCMDPSDVLI